MDLFSNPEFLRNVRSQLRPGRVIATALISAVVSVTLGFLIAHANKVEAGPDGWGFSLLKTTIFLQALVLAAGGGIACLNSIQKEKEQNTFDFQRVTRLTPLELTLGKLFGAPVLSYFICLCLMPLAIFAAVVGRQRVSIVLAAYVILFSASLAFHAFALLLSMFSVRGAHTSSIIFLLVILWAGAYPAPGQMFELGSLGPFNAATMAEQTSWATPHLTYNSYYRQVYGNVSNMTDSLFGHDVHHFPVQIATDLLLACWFLLAVVRNIKRDPNHYEMFSPMQSLAFALFLNLMFLAFFNWQWSTSLDSQSVLLTLNMVVFMCLGLAMLRNRERMRRILRACEAARESWLDILWPAPLVTFGGLVAGLLIVAAVTIKRDPHVDWNVNMAVFRTLFFVAWLVRDIQFLQWMSLRRGKHPLVMGVLYQIIFYACTAVFLSIFGFYSTLDRVPFSAFAFPTSVYLLDYAAWALRPAIWASAFIAQWLLAAAFIYLKWQLVGEIAGRRSSPETANALA